MVKSESASFRALSLRYPQGAGSERRSGFQQHAILLALTCGLPVNRARFQEGVAKVALVDFASKSTRFIRSQGRPTVSFSIDGVTPRAGVSQDRATAHVAPESR